MLVTSTAVLLTKGDKTRNDDQPRKKKKRDKKKVPEPATREYSFNFESTDEDSDDDLICRATTPDPDQVYLHVCRKLNVMPLSRVRRQLGQRHVRLRDTMLGNKGVNALCVALLQIPSVTTIDLSQNKIESVVVPCINEVVVASRSLTTLNLSGNQLGGLGIRRLSRGLWQNNMIKKLNLSDTALRDRDAESVALLLESTREVTELNLSHNQLREDGGVQLGKALGVNQCIEYLDLSWNHLRGRGAEGVALALVKNRTLYNLDVSWNGFGFEGCSAMAIALRCNTNLTDLDLTSNRIHPSGLYELLNGLVTNKVLRSLKLGQNPIPALTTSALLGRIKRSPEMRLEELDLSGIVVDKDFEVALEELQETRDFIARYDMALPVNKDKLGMKTKKKKTYNVDPMRLLFSTKKNLRIVDLFNKIDVDGSGKVSRDEIRASVEAENLPLTAGAIDKIMEAFGAGHNGQIGLREFMEAERRLKRMDAVSKEKFLLRHRQMKAEGTALDENGIPVDRGGVGGRFSMVFRPDLENLDPDTLEIVTEDPHLLTPRGRRASLRGGPSVSPNSNASRRSPRRNSLTPGNGVSPGRDSLTQRNGASSRRSSVNSLTPSPRRSSVTLLPATTRRNSVSSRRSSVTSQPQNPRRISVTSDKPKLKLPDIFNSEHS